jgi:hypothetical protein
VTSWNTYKRILDEKIGDKEYELKVAESRFRQLKAEVKVLHMEAKAFEDEMQVKMEDLGVEVETIDLFGTEKWRRINKVAGKPLLADLPVSGDSVGSMLDTKLTKEDHEAAQLSIFFSGNI